MKKLANMPMDISDQLLEEDMETLLEVIRDLPESVKTAHIPSTEDVINTDEEKFALVTYHPSAGFQKKFANYNEDLTLLNTKMFIKKEADLPDELCKTAGSNLYRAHKRFKLEIPESLEKYASDEFVDNVVDLTEVNEVAYLRKLDSKEVDIVDAEKLAYALPTEEKFPIHDEFHQSKAVEFFEKHANTLDIDSRIEYAKNLKSASESTSEKIEKYARINTAAYNDDVVTNLRARKRLLKQANHKYVDGLLSKLADMQPKVAFMYLEEIDKNFGLDNLYNKHIDDAVLSCFGLHKEASVQSKSGVEVTQSDLESITKCAGFDELVSEDMQKALRSDKALEVFGMMSQTFQDRLIGLNNENS